MNKTRDRLLLAILVAQLVLIVMVGILITLFLQQGYSSPQVAVAERIIVVTPTPLVEDGDDLVGSGDVPAPRSGDFAAEPEIFDTPTPESSDDSSSSDTSSSEDASTEESGESSSSATEESTEEATTEATESATEETTDTPTDEPTSVVTDEPTDVPTSEPTSVVTEEPTDEPTSEPTEVPTEPPPTTINLPSDPFERINAYRTLAAVGLVDEDSAWSDGAYNHAIYMAKNRGIIYSEDVSNPYYTLDGKEAASKSNLWYGNGVGLWTGADAIDAWMLSPFHRLWVLYPQAAEMGFGFYEDSSGASGGGTAATLRVFGGWDTSIVFISPLKYPAANQEDVPALRYGVSLQFPVNTANPTFTSVSWVDEDGQAVTFEQLDPVSSSYMRDHGNAIFLLPVKKLSPSTRYSVRIQGEHRGQSFDISWEFTTSD